MLWDVFCKVVDNFGDIGVCWRLAADLAARGEQVRLWVDDASALAWMAPEGSAGVTVLPWAQAAHPVGLPPPDVLVEAFGCPIAPEYIAHCTDSKLTAARKRLWINLEYLSAEPFAERSHGLPSPVLGAPGLAKFFFYPGFTERTGGLLREPDLPARQRGFDRAAWLARFGIPAAGDRLISLFCYEPPALPALLRQLAGGPARARLLVTAGRASAACLAALARLDADAPEWNDRGMLAVHFLPTLTQRDYDHLLWACELNFVRGEDSLVRALWAGKPFVWQIYPQQDGAHFRKLGAFLDWLAAPASWRSFHLAWNGAAEGGGLPALDAQDWASAGQTAQAARARLLAQPDLTTRQLRFVREKVRM
ncbi:MAG: elongation factor P maturation arginine rhamnosyltransferase EarP [Proteobacteria bacterium]|nr:elongation factor P maturation arginine rhamnosyltransferase EarP [Pseudomonadota bacterium]